MPLDSASLAAVDAAQAAITAVAQGTATGRLQDASLAELQPAIAAAQAAYATLDAAFQAADAAVQGVDLDAITGASTPEGIAAFQAEAAACSNESDCALARAYMGRIVSNLTLAGG